MAKYEDKELSLEEIWRLIEQLSPDDTNTLLNKMRDKTRFQRLSGRDDTNLSQAVSQTWQQLIERLSTGEIDQDIKNAANKAWADVLSSLGAAELLQAGRPQESSVSDDAMSLEQIYQDMNSKLIEVRLGVAQAIATEKQLEHQLEKNVHLTKNWLERLNTALQEKNSELSEQARHRHLQYSQAAEQLTKLLDEQRLVTQNLRDRLTETEAKVQKAYTKQQILIARDRVTRATIKANQLLDKLGSSELLSKMEAIQKRVEEREALVAARMDKLPEQRPSRDILLAQAVQTLEQATSVMERVELLLQTQKPAEA